MKKEFVSYGMALELKELEFDEPCFTYYYNISGKLRTNISVDINNGWAYEGNKKSGIILAPTLSQAFRFFREKYRLEGAIYRLNFKWASQVFNIETSTYCFKHELFEKYEEAEIHSLQKMIKIIKNK
jgi:hypothetical protein